MSNIRIEYGDIVVGADEAFDPSTSAELYDVSDDISELMTGTKCRTNPCEGFCTSLDGSVTLLESPYESKGIWSLAMSEEDGTFSTPITVTLTASEAFTTNGLMLTFDTLNYIFPTDTHIAFYLDSTIVEEEDITIDGAYYMYDKKIDAFNKVELTFNALNLPECHLRLSKVEFGHVIIFEDEEIKSVKVTQQINPVASELCIGTCQIELNLKNPDSYTFSKEQPLLIFHRENLIGKYFIVSSKRDGQYKWSLDTEDYIGLLDDANFDGRNVLASSALTVLPEILQSADLEDVQLNIDAAFMALNGVIKAGTVREAFGQVAFAANLLVDTSYSDTLNVTDMPRELSQTIPADRVMDGAKFETTDAVSSVTASSHAYAAAGEDERETVYTAVEDDVEKEIIVKFDGEKMYTYYTVNSGYPIEFSPFYIKFIPYSTDSTVTAVPYRDSAISKTYTSNTVTGVAKNEMQIEDATLVSRNNIDSVLKRCYDQYSKRNKYTCRVIERPSDTTLKVGDIVRVATPWAVNGGEKYYEGRITQQTFSLVGGITVKDLVIE